MMDDKDMLDPVNFVIFYNLNTKTSYKIFIII